MSVWDVILGVVVALGVLAILAVVGISGRRRWVARYGGVFDCSLRTHRTSGRGWMLGIARYSGDDLQWFRLFSMSFRPREIVRRKGLIVLERRGPQGAEPFSLHSGHIVLECSASGGDVDLAMSEDAVTGFLAWLEAAPPGRDSLAY